ncbi:unnamed protein product, partial [Thelazia callipaeda]|uniref:DUF2012 domain-containing protein n=1 Tax=Thelazia callipaeda TaxID=103827 RepID=A0A0N5CQA0_THECL
YNGSFVVSGVPPGSYIVEVSNVEYAFEPVRVDISSKGKIRARRLNLLQPSLVSSVPYPLRLNALHRVNYFLPREEWHITDMLINEMVLMMALPLILHVVASKLVSANDPEFKKPFSSSQVFQEMVRSMLEMDFPDASEVLTSWLAGYSKKPRKSAAGNKKEQETIIYVP